MMTSLLPFVLLLTLTIPSFSHLQQKLKQHQFISEPSIPNEDNVLTKQSFQDLSSQLKPDQVLTYKSECNQQWNYYFSGSDWNCQCSINGLQSPINLCGQSSSKVQNDKYLFQFLDKMSFNLKYNEENEEKSKIMVVNTGKTIKIEYPFGQIDLIDFTTKKQDNSINIPQYQPNITSQIFPQYSKDFPQSLLIPNPQQSLNLSQNQQQLYLRQQPSEPVYQPNDHLQELTDQYKGYSIHFHVPSEHSVNGQLFDMEMHMVYKNTKLTDLSLSASNVDTTQVSSSYEQSPFQSFQSPFFNAIQPQQQQKMKEDQDYLIVVILFKGIEMTAKQAKLKQQNQFFNNLEYQDFSDNFQGQTEINKFINFDLLFQNNQNLIQDILYNSKYQEDNQIFNLKGDFNVYMLQYIKVKKTQTQFKDFLKKQYDLQSYSRVEQQAEDALFFLTEKDIQKVIDEVSCEKLYDSNVQPKILNKRFTDSNLESIIEYLTYDPGHPLYSYFSYGGSQSSPPCTGIVILFIVVLLENVNYIVKKDAIELDMNIIKTFANKIQSGGSEGGNARQTQAPGNRKINYYEQQNIWSILGFMKNLKCWSNPFKVKEVIYHFVLGSEKKYKDSEMVDLKKASPFVRDVLIRYLKQLD